MSLTCLPTTAEIVAGYQADIKFQRWFVGVLRTQQERWQDNPELFWEFEQLITNNENVITDCKQRILDVMTGRRRW